jgi:AmiR/NasT family two-component response regulator
LGDGETLDLLQAGDPAQLRVHQATGMVAQQTSLSLPDSLALMRAYAVTQDLSLWDVAERVVTRRIRMDTT